MNCDKYAQPVELGENWLGAYVMVKWLGCLEVNKGETVVISCQLRRRRASKGFRNEGRVAES